MRFGPLEAADLPLLHEWLQRPHVRRLWSDHETYENVVEHSSDVILLLSADGRILYASASNAKVLGFPSEERIGRSAFELVHPDDQARVRVRARAQALRARS